jgi:Tfp pilus assembly protein PilO
MNLLLSRELLSQVVIILALSVGGWMLIVQPKISELGELKTMVAEAGSDPNAMGEQAIGQMADRMRAVRSRLVEIDAKNRFAEDTSRMYGIVMDLAREHDVVVRQLDPDSGRRAGDDEESIRVASLDLTVQGEYEQIAVFLSAMDSLGGFLRPKSLNVTPQYEEGRRFAEANFSCDVLRFALPEALAAMVGADDADE